MAASNVDTWGDGPGPIGEGGGGLDACGVPVVAAWPPRVAMDVAVALSGLAVDPGAHRGGEPVWWWEVGPGGEVRVDRDFRLDRPAAGEQGGAAA